MKIGIITFIDTMNYGALLQGFALCKTLNNLGAETKVVNYRFQDFKKDYYVSPKFSFNLLLSPTGIARYILGKSIAKHEKVRFYRSRNFVAKHIPITPLCCTSAEIDALGMQVHVCGSDQIWNPSITNGLLDAFFGGTSESVKKIAFSASCPEIDKLKNRQEEFIRSVKQMDSIAVREKELKDYLSELGIVSTVTIDPTLLLDKEDYIGIASEIKPTKPYIFIYNLGRKDSHMLANAQRLAKKNNWDIIEIPTYIDFTAKHKQIFNAAPDEFLGYMAHAEYIMTNSFHGTVFSIILEKNFLSFSANARSSRITNILRELQLDSRLNQTSLPITDIDYNSVKGKLTTLRETSIEYLRCAINSTK